jgi:hypothetical protein
MNELDKSRNRVSPPQPCPRFELNNKCKIIRGRIAAIGQGVGVNLHGTAAAYHARSQAVCLHTRMIANRVVPEHKASTANAIESPAAARKSIIFGKHEAAGPEIRAVRPRRIPIAIGVALAVPARRGELDEEQISALVEQVVVNDAVEPALRLQSVGAVSADVEVVVVDSHGFRTSGDAYDAVVRNGLVGGAGVNGQPRKTEGFASRRVDCKGGGSTPASMIRIVINDRFVFAATGRLCPGTLNRGRVSLIVGNRRGPMARSRWNTYEGTIRRDFA